MKNTTTDLNPEMFKAYDIRTPAELLPPELSERLYHAMGEYFRSNLKTKKVVICRDARSSGPDYMEQGIQIFKACGFEVIVNPQVCSTSHFYFTCMKHDDAAGIMIGASHNPGEDTGRKIVGPGAIPIAVECGPDGGLEKIKELYLENFRMKPIAGGSVTFVNHLKEYISYSMELAGVKPDSLTGTKIMMDFLHGAAGEEFAKAFDLAGANVTLCNSIPDGSFPAGPPNPVVAGSIEPSLKKLQDGSYDFAFFFDGDGDRLDIYSGKGQQLNPCFNIAVLAPELKKLHVIDEPGLFACLKANPTALTQLSAAGVKASCIRNGHSQIKNSLLSSTDYIGAVEESAHYYLNFPYNDKIFASENTLFFGLLTARYWSTYPQKYQDALEQQRQSYREREWGYKFPDTDNREQALNQIETLLCDKGGKSVTEMADGTPMGATLIRIGLPIDIDSQSIIEEKWIQVAQRVSQSEVGLARWEVSAATQGLVEETVGLIETTVQQFGAGEKYIG